MPKIEKPEMVKERLSRTCYINDEGCWIWKGVRSSAGYSMSWYKENGVKHSTNGHRLSYMLYKGEIPPKHIISQSCRNRACINPEHLEVLTYSEHTKRAKNSPKQIVEAHTGYLKQISLTLTDKERIERNSIVDENGCWIWQRRLDKSGYGRCHYMRDGKRISGTAYRMAYRAYKGEVPEGLHIDHLCRVVSCVNPEHLEAVTQAENNRRGLSVTAINSLKTHCAQGHPYDEENTGLYTRPSDSGTSRYCKACRAIWNEKAKEKYAQNK